MLPLFYIINTLLTVCLYVTILRLWMQYTRVSYHNPYTQFIIKVTHPIIGPLRKIIPSMGRVDTATCLVVYILALIKFIAILYFVTISPYFDWQYLLYALLVIAHAIGHLLFWILLIRAILSWFSQHSSSLEEVLYQLSEPFIAPIRRFVPPIGNIDLSFMIFVFLLTALNMVFISQFSPWWGIISL